jgi:hypothetical protein
MAASSITLHEAEEMSDCVSAIRIWREAVCEVNERGGSLRLDHERACYAHMYSFHPSVRAEAEAHVNRSGR